MDFLIVNTSLMVKGKNYPEGGIISDSLLSEQDSKELSKFLKPVDSKETQPEKSDTAAAADSQHKTSRKVERVSK